MVHNYVLKTKQKNTPNLRKFAPPLLISENLERFNFKTCRYKYKNSYKKCFIKFYHQCSFISAGYSECLFCLSHILARLDVLVSFAVAASTAPLPYCRPVLSESLDKFEMTELRHPLLEVQDGVSYIPNDVKFDRGKLNLKRNISIILR